MENVVLIAIMIGFVMVFIAYKKADNSSKRKEAFELIAQKLPEFTIQQKFEGIGSHYMFLVDTAHSKIALLLPTVQRIVPFSDIIAVEVIEDGETISTKSTSRTIGGAIIGSVLGGGIGAIVGGLSGGSTHSEKASSVIVKILLRDILSPALQIVCFDSKTMTSSGADSYYKKGKSESHLYVNGKKQATQIKDVVSVIIDKVDRESKEVTSRIDLSTSRPSITEELLKLHQLKEIGALSEEEFQSQKSKLLAL